MQEIEDGVQKLFKLFGLFSVALIVLPLGLFGESFADFKRNQAGSFQSYKDAKDKEFNTYLKEQWKEYEAFKAQQLFTKPKPKTIEEMPQVKVKEIGPRIDIAAKTVPKIEAPVQKKSAEPVKIVEITQPVKAVAPVAVPEPVAVPAPKMIEKDVMFNFFGTNLGFDIDEKMKNVRFYPKNQNGIINFFNVVASSEYEGLLREITKVVKDMKLNDWGLHQLVEELAIHTYTQPDEQKLLRWFLLSKLAYNVKVGLVGQHVVLLQPTKQTVYATPRYKIDGQYYYAIDHANSGKLGRLYTYDKSYPDAEKKLDFTMKKVPHFVKDIKLKKLHFKDMIQSYEVDLHLNKNLVDFMATYPQVDYSVYFNAGMDKGVYTELSQALRTYINGKKASYGLNFVLHFVQKSFGYQRDDEQFGKEKIMFAEETLYYDKSDCEDRAILFAQLIRKLFNYGVIGVKYSDHMSTALYVPLDGDKVIVGTKRYVVADPTYINANIGNSMPKYRNIQPESFVRLR